MSMAVCGRKRSFFEDQSPALTKRLRCSSSAYSPIKRFSAPYLVDQLRSLFPRMHPQVLERALQECGDNMDAAIKRLHELCLRSAEEAFASADEQQPADITVASGSGVLANDEAAAITENQTVAISNLPTDGAEWIELFVREMMSANSVDDARTRAAKVLEVLEKSISGRASAEATQSFQKENLVLKEQMEGLARENTVLKRAVVIQLERQKESEERNKECEHLKQLVSQYQEQLRTLEVNNYALTMHLKQAEQSNSIPGRFHPHVF